MIEKYLIESEMEYAQKIEELEQEIEKYKHYIKRKEEENERIKTQEIPGEELLSPLIKEQDNHGIFHEIQKYTEAIEELHKEI